MLDLTLLILEKIFKNVALLKFGENWTCDRTIYRLLYSGKGIDS